MNDETLRARLKLSAMCLEFGRRIGLHCRSASEETDAPSRFDLGCRFHTTTIWALAPGVVYGSSNFTEVWTPLPDHSGPGFRAALLREPVGASRERWGFGRSLKFEGSRGDARVPSPLPKWFEICADATP